MMPIIIINIYHSMKPAQAKSLLYNIIQSWKNYDSTHPQGSWIDPVTLGVQIKRISYI